MTNILTTFLPIFFVAVNVVVVILVVRYIIKRRRKKKEILNYIKRSCPVG